MTTVKELIELLETLDPNYKVIMSKDSEGNGFSPVSEIGSGEWVARSKWSGEVLSKEDCEENGDEYEEDCIVLWPTN